MLNKYCVWCRVGKNKWRLLTLLVHFSKTSPVIIEGFSRLFSIVVTSPLEWPFIRHTFYSVSGWNWGYKINKWVIPIFQELSSFLEKWHLLELEASVSDVCRRREHATLWEQYDWTKAQRWHTAWSVLGITCILLLLHYIRKEVVRDEAEDTSWSMKDLLHDGRELEHYLFMEGIHWWF